MPTHWTQAPSPPAAARAEFDADVTYLDTATFGLPPRRSWAALQQALAQWRAGTAQAVAYDLPLAAARSSYARLAGVDPSVVAVGSQVSVFAGLIAANLPGGSEVLTATGDFTSILFPFYAQPGRGIRIREVPLERIAESMTSRTTLVAVSAVQSEPRRRRLAAARHYPPPSHPVTAALTHGQIARICTFPACLLHRAVIVAGAL